MNYTPAQVEKLFLEYGIAYQKNEPWELNSLRDELLIIKRENPKQFNISHFAVYNKFCGYL